MPKFSAESQAKLETCDPRIQKVMAEAIKVYDFTVQEGHRSVARQQKLFAQGRTEPGQIVTQIDGVTKKGEHNYSPARAVDITPYPAAWDAPVTEFHYMAGVVMACAAKLGIRLEWGGHWKRFKDYPHFQVVD